MSINVGELAISLRADVARLQGDMNDAKQAVGGAMKDIEQYVGYAKTAFLSLGGVLTITAFKDAIGGAIEFKARLLDLSAQTGIGVEALGALGKTGKLTATTLDDITSASAKLSKAVQTQNEDSKGAAQAIAALGLNFTTFKNLRPEEQMLAVAKAMAGFADGTGKTADAMLLFGKTGATLLPFLRDLAERTDLNSRQTEEASKQAKAYEDNLKKITAAGSIWKDQLANYMLPALAEFTRQMVEAKTISEKFAAIWSNVKSNFGFDALGMAETRSKAASVEIERLTNVMIGLSNVLQSDPGNEAARRRYENLANTLRGLQSDAAKANDVLKGMANVDIDNYSNEGRAKPKPQIKLPDGSKDTGGATQKDLYADLIKVVNERLAQQELEAVMGRKLTDIESLQAKAYADIDAGLIKATLKQKLYVDALFDRAKTEAALAKQYEDSRAENNKTLDAADRRLSTLRDEGKAVQVLLDEYGMSREQLQALAIARDRETAAILRQRAAGMDDVGAMGQLRDVYLAQADALTQLATRKDALAAKEARDRNDPQTGALIAVKNYLADVQRAGDSTRAAVENSLKGLEDSTVSVLRGGNAKDAAKQWVNGIITEVYRLYVVKPLLASIFGGGSGSGGGFFGSLLSLAGGLLGGDANASGSGSFASPAGISGGRADGGPVESGKSYLVGERGPEVVRMNGGANVIPNNALGGGPVNIQIVNNTGTAASAKANQLDDGTIQLILEKMEDRVAGSIAGGGKVAAAMAGTFQLNRAGSSPRY